MKILRDSKSKARKEHKCDFCGLVIKVGEIYQNQTNVLDGDLYTWKSHLSCGKIANKLNMFDDFDEGLTGEDFKELIEDEYYKITQNNNPPDFSDQLDFVKKYHL